MNRPAIGQKVFFKKQAIKSYSQVQPNRIFRTVWHTWDIKSRFGFFIGYRTVFDGITTVDYEGKWFTQQGSHQVWLVVKNDRQNPLYIDPYWAVIIPDCCPNCLTANDLLFHPGGGLHMAFTFCWRCMVAADTDDEITWLSFKDGQWIDDYDGSSLEVLKP